jgi:enamine deaminase RidA (YjgF/YER057c/UK114 family)
MTAEVLQVLNQGSAACWQFPLVRRVGDAAYVGMQVMPPAGAPDITAQTNHVFQCLIAALESVGMQMSDLKKLHTYYIYDGDGAAVTGYWENMTATRLKYLANPGPAATALRIRGLAPGGPLIGIDGIAELSATAERIMPEHAWDWSIPTPFSQGWRVGDTVYVGGQISADRSGRALDPGQVVPQTTNTLEYIRHVLRDAGSGWQDVVSIKIAYQCRNDGQPADDTLASILAQVDALFPHAKPALICFGVDLLYEGLLLEIDAMAVKALAHQPVVPPGADTWVGTALGFPPARLAGKQLFIGGQSAPGAASITAQAEATMSRVGDILAQADADYGDLVKLNVYYCSEGAAGPVGAPRIIAQVLENYLRQGRTVVSMVEVAELMHPGQRIQIDGLAVLGQDS